MIPTSVVAKQPCESLSLCPAEFGPDAQRLRLAYDSYQTTDDQRAKMQTTIDAHTSGGIVDWPAAASEYFAWRAEFLKPEVSPTAPRPHVEFDQMRQSAEAAIRSRLIDPHSAQIDWPSGFAQTGWKRLFQKRVYGWATCGYVNSRNRFGGYVGRTNFAVVLDDSANILHLEIGDNSELDLTQIACQNSRHIFPAYTTANKMPERREKSEFSSISVADELGKLAELRDKGVITELEFQAQKAKLLGR